MTVEHMPPGPSQAGWLALAAGAADRLDENGLVGVAIAARGLASWAQACELTAVAQITARTAAADRRIGTGADGRPVRINRDALGQVALALMLTHDGAEAWTDLAVTLTWRLPATGAALAAGRIDLYRARLIAQATSVLSEDAARAVEERVLPGAGARTPAHLRARLRRVVIAVDPDGAERRRERAERHAKVSLYGDNDGTATLSGAGLPAVHAAAAMARITALAKAMQAAGQPGGLDLHRARVMIGLLLGTLPYIPPADGAPPDHPPPEGGGPGDEPGDGPGGPGDDPGDGPGPAGSSGGSDDVPDPGDEDAPPGDGLDDVGAGADHGADPVGQGDGPDLTGPAPDWPSLGTLPPAPASRPAGPADGRPVPGLLDAIVPWTTLTGLARVPGLLSRIGPVTAAEARLLARAAEADPAAQWRVVVTNAAGQAITVARIRRRQRSRDGPPGPAPPSTGLVGRITLTITQDALIDAVRRPGLLGGIAAAALRTAARARARAQARAEADAAAGGCAHHAQSPGYRPPPRLREYVTARDMTCRSPVCRQPAWRADLDHTRPWAPGGQGGRTCSCNLGGGCRRDHQLKQDPRWNLEQTRPGFFTWTTPAGRTCTVGPDTYPV